MDSSSNSDRLQRIFMWNRVKKLSVINTKMSSTQPDEIAIEAINAPLSSETTTTITDPILQEKMDQIVPDDDDDSSIEALAWTDFTDDELETAKELAAKEFPSNDQQQQQEEQEQDEKENLDPNVVSESQISEKSCSSSNSNSKESEEDSPCSLMSISTSQTLVLTGNDDEDGDIAIVNYNDSAKQDNSNMEMDETMNELIPKSSSLLFEDKASNAPVLDDGPIWGTGTKLYKFHENRERNQKLTFWVLMSVVLAIGVGVGNLVAYNEYENDQRFDGPSKSIHEHKPIDQQHCPAPIIPTVAPYINNPSVAESSINIKVLDKNFEQAIGKDNHFNTILKSPEIRESSPSSYVPSLHTETLAHVVKSIDELSKKIDIFNNTTKQLSGIIVMKEDVKSKVRSSTDEFSQFLPSFNDDVSKQNQWENKINEPVCSKSQKRVKPNHDIPKKQDKVTGNNNDNNNNSKLKPKEPKQNNEAREEEELNNEVSGKKKQKKNKDPAEINTDEKYQKYKTKEEKSKRKQEKYDKKKQQQYADKTIKNEKKEKKYLQMKEKSIILDNGEETEKQFQYQQGKQKKFKRETVVEKEFESDKYNKKNKKPKTRKAEYDTLKRDEKSFDNDNQQKHHHNQKQKNVYNKPEKDYYEKEYKSDKKTKKPKKNNNKDDTKFVIVENQGNSFFVASETSETIPEKRRRKDSEKEVEKNKNNGKPQHVDGKNGKNFKKDKQADSGSSDEENYNQKSNVYKKQVKVSTDYKMNNNKDQDWNSERAKARESIRVYQNWNSDFSSDNNDYKVKRKRSSSWQIERDRLREKIRKNEDD